MKKFFLAALVALLFPIAASADISITEIAWMGTVNSQYEEWIELYNGGNTDVSVAGWKIVKSGGTTLYPLTGSIPAGAHYVVCRTTASLTNPMAGLCDEQGAWGGSGLNNSSDEVVVKDGSGAVVDSASGIGGWPAGESSSKKTMQKSGSGWITAAPTPGVENTSDDSGVSEEEPEDDPEPEEESEPVPKKDTKEKIEKIKPDPGYEAHMIIPDYGVAGVAVPIVAEVKRDKVFTTIRGRYAWSMGDGASFLFSKNEPIAHVFEYPGTYTVVLAFYSDRFRDEPDSIHRKQIVIAPASIAIAGPTDDGGIILKNDSTRDIDLAGWQVETAGVVFSFPRYTMIAKGASLSVSSKTLGMQTAASKTIVKNPSGIVIARFARSISANSGSDAGLLGASVAEAVDEIEASAPQSSDTQRSWIQGIKEYGWYLGFLAVAIAAAVAYFIARLYSFRKEIEDEELEGDIL